MYEMVNALRCLGRDCTVKIYVMSASRLGRAGEELLETLFKSTDSLVLGVLYVVLAEAAQSSNVQGLPRKA